MGPPNVPAPPRRRIGRSARPRASRVHTLAAVCTARLLLLQVVALLLSPALPPRQYKFHATCRSPGPAGLRAPWKRGQGPRGACPARGRARPQPHRGYRGDNITMIPGPRLRESKRPALFHRLLTPCCARRVPLAAEGFVNLLTRYVNQTGVIQNRSDLDTWRGEKIRQAWSPCGHPSHGETALYRLCAHGGKEAQARQALSRVVTDHECPPRSSGGLLVHY